MSNYIGGGRPNGATHAAAGLMHPDSTKERIHDPGKGNEIDFYAQGTGTKVSGVVLRNDRREGGKVHIKQRGLDGERGEFGSNRIHRFTIGALPPDKLDENSINEIYGGKEARRALDDSKKNFRDRAFRRQETADRMADATTPDGKFSAPTYYRNMKDPISSSPTRHARKQQQLAIGRKLRSSGSYSPKNEGTVQMKTFRQFAAEIYEARKEEDSVFNRPKPNPNVLRSTAGHKDTTSVKDREGPPADASKTGTARDVRSGKVKPISEMKMGIRRGSNRQGQKDPKIISVFKMKLNKKLSVAGHPTHK